MRSFTMMFLAFALGATLVGCGGGAAPREQAPDPQAAGAPADSDAAEGHAAADVVPGSYEDWCDEHAVAESACTRCDAVAHPGVQGDGRLGCRARPAEVPVPHCDPDLKIVRPREAGGD